MTLQFGRVKREYLFILILAKRKMSNLEKIPENTLRPINDGILQFIMYFIL